MLAIGAGGLEVAPAIAGEPFSFEMPLVWGIKLAGSHPDWVLAKDVILEMLRRHKADGAKGRIIEYYGPGLASLSAMDRHVIADMGAELGATTSVFPSDPEVGRFLKRQKRDQDWGELTADRGATYDLNDYRRADGCCTAICRSRLTAESARTAGVPMRVRHLDHVQLAMPAGRDDLDAHLRVRGEEPHDQRRKSK
jgi:hypothetical protein